jgi:HEAT repeat protein
MNRLTVLFSGLAAVWLLIAVSPSRGDYLGKPAAQWQLQLAGAKDATARRSAAFALGKCGLQALQAVPDLMRCLESESEDMGVRETAAYSLGQIVMRGSASPDLVRLLSKLAAAKATDDQLARSALVALGNCGTDTADIRAALETALVNPSPAVRQNAAWALGEVCQKTDDPPVSSLRLTLSGQEKDKLVKRDAALALSKIVSQHGPAVGFGNAEQKERDRIAKVRDYARAAIPELLNCIADDYVELKKAAAGALVNIVNSQDGHAASALAKACTKSEDIEVRLNAAQALAAIGGKGSEAAVPVLQDVLRSNKGNPEWRQNAVLALRNLGSVGAAVLPNLLEVLARDPDRKVRYYAAVALGGWQTANKQVVPALVQRVVDGEEDLEVRVAAAVSLQSIGQCDEAAAAIPVLVQVLANPEQPPRVRERVLWALRVHQAGLSNHDEVFAALKAILTEPGLRNPRSGGKMLRYDAAYLSAVFKKASAPKEVFPVLEDFLKDNDVRLFAGVKTGGARVAEGGSGKSVVAEQGIEDGRIMAVQGLQEIGPARVKNQGAIIAQLTVLRDSQQAIEPKLREAATTLLKDCGK